MGDFVSVFFVFVYCCAGVFMSSYWYFCVVAVMLFLCLFVCVRVCGVCGPVFLYI